MRRDLPTEGTSLLGAQIFAFYDLAAAWNRDPVNGTFKSSIASGGIGARLLLPGQLRAEFELAKPLTAPVFDGDGRDREPRAFFGLSMTF